MESTKHVLMKYLKITPLLILVFVLFLSPGLNCYAASSIYFDVYMDRPAVNATQGYVEILCINPTYNVPFVAVYYFTIFDDDNPTPKLEVSVFNNYMQLRTDADRVEVVYMTNGASPEKMDPLGTDEGLHAFESYTLWESKAFHSYGPVELDYLVTDPWNGYKFTTVYNNERPIYESLQSLLVYLENNLGWTQEQIEDLLNGQTTLSGQFNEVLSYLSGLYPILENLEFWSEHLSSIVDMWLGGIHNMLVEFIYNFNANDPLESIEGQKDKIEQSEQVEQGVRDEIDSMEQENAEVQEQVDQVIEEGQFDTGGTWGIMDALLGSNPKIMTMVMSCMSIAVIGLILNR